VDVVWVAEAYGNDAPTRLGYLAAQTHRAELRPAILPSYSLRPPSLPRPRLGSTRSPAGEPFCGWVPPVRRSPKAGMARRTNRPVQRTREIIDICRMIWRRKEIRYDGRAIKLPLPADQGRVWANRSRF
jgi:alkanesulfonate monooxygenase SsuD/methylene tetrahydromethanopterin reductase-like flavin-dependent oxidoreductase (luciferase family)